MGFRQLLSEKERERLVKSHLVRNSPSPSHAQTSGFGEQSFPAENLHRAHSVQGQRLSKGSGSTELFLQGLKKSPGSPENGDKLRAQRVGTGTLGENGSRSGTLGSTCSYTDASGIHPATKPSPNASLALFLRGRKVHSQVSYPV